MYLPGDAQDRLFELVTELSAPGSRIAVETVAKHNADRREQLSARFRDVSEKLGLDDSTDMQAIGELMYDDPARADVAAWLAARGWSSDSVTSDHEMRRLDRHVGISLGDGDSFSSFVTGTRH